MEHLIPLIERTVAHDRAAWPKLLVSLEPEFQRMVRSMRRLRCKGRAQPEDVAQIRQYVFERLAANNYANLQGFLQQRSRRADPIAFDRWHGRLVRHAAMDHLRFIYGRRPAQPSSQTGHVQPSHADMELLAQNPDLELGREPQAFLGVTSRLTITEILAFVRQTFSQAEIAALQTYFIGATFTEIAAEFGLADAKAAEHLIRKLKERLRERFRTDDGAV